MRYFLRVRLNTRPSRRVAVLALTCIAVTGLLLIAPFVVRAVAPRNLNWSELSDISQVYSSVSVVFSAAALAGVGFSLVLQGQQTRAAQEEASWASHREMIFRAIEDPELAVCWEPPTAARSRREWRQIAYTNLIVTAWDKSYRLGRITAEQLPVVLRQHFRGRLARQHWAAARQEWMQIAQTARSRRTQQFPLIVDAEYQRALASGPAVEPADYFPADI